MQRSIIKRIGLFITVLFTFFLISNCRTSKNEVVKEKIQINKEKIQINKIDSTAKVIKNNKILESDSISWNNFFKDYTINYNGVSNEDSFEVIRTDQGFRFQGKGNATLKEQTNKSDSINNKVKSEEINEDVNIKSDSKSEYNLDEDYFSKDKHHEDSSSGFNWNFTIILIIVICLSIYLFYRHLKSK